MRQVVNEITQVLTSEETTAIHGRLFPDAFDDPEETQKYNALVHDELKAHKLRALDTIRNTLEDAGRVGATLPPDEAHLWLTALTDIRLALGVRLEVSEEDMGREPDPDDPNALAMAVLHWLGWLQEMMVEKLSEGTET